MGADGYRLTVGTTSGGSEILNNQNVGNTTSYNFPADFAEGVTVFATITPYNSVGDALGCAEENFIITSSTGPGAPECIVLNFPADGATNIPITSNLEWFALTNATGYRLTVGTTIGGNEILSTTDVGNSTFYDFPSNLPENTTIYVKLRPYNDIGVATECLEQSFSTEALTVLPTCAILTTPAESTNVSLTTNLIWNAPAAATGYRLRVGTTPGGIEIINNEDIGNVTTYDFVDNLPDDRMIYVNITPYNSVGDAIGCIEQSFETTTKPSVPACTTFINPLLDAVDVPLNTTFEWIPVPTATGYYLSVGTTSAGIDILDAFDVQNVTSYTLPNDLPANTLIFVKITPYNDVGPSPICEKEKFTTVDVPSVPDCTTLLSPANTLEDIPLATDITWSASPTAVGYRLSLGTFPGGTDILDNSDVGNITTYNGQTDLPQNTLIYVTITPYNSLGDAVGCSEEYFKTVMVNPDLDCASLFIPANGAINVDITTDLIWNTALNADGYRVSVGTTSGGTDILKQSRSEYFNFL